MSSRGVHGGVPTFFKALCFEARHGGTSGYSIPGWHLAIALGSEAPDDLDLDEWSIEVDKLRELLTADDDRVVFGWFAEHYPKCMALVPARRRGQFVAGVRGADEQGRVEL
jgi:hypothetical protein